MTNFKASSALFERVSSNKSNPSLTIDPLTVNFDVQSVINSERMFLVVLATMTSVLGAICVYFILNL